MVADSGALYSNSSTTAPQGEVTITTRAAASAMPVMVGRVGPGGICRTGAEVKPNTSTRKDIMGSSRCTVIPV
jgi:hypothetical protein